MPNHVYSALKFIYHDDNGEMIEKVSQLLKGENSLIDFNKIIPQPTGIQDEREGVLSDAEYNWCIENWGTKWNAYGVNLKEKDSWKMVFHLQTAWSIPEPILNKLFELFPEVEINYVCADDGGWFAYHILKNQNEEPIKRVWTSDNDNEGIVRSAMFEALNCSY